jgi:hypothetical protein
MAIDDLTPDFPPIRTPWVIDWLMEVGPTDPGAMGAVPISWGSLICPLLGGPKYMLFWTRKEKTNAIQETHAGGDYRQAA